MAKYVQRFQKTITISVVPQSVTIHKPSPPTLMIIMFLQESGGSKTKENIQHSQLPSVTQLSLSEGK